MQRIRVLLAEDHGVVREGTRRILEEHDDMEVVAEVAHGDVVVAEARRCHPDVVLLDIRLPGTNGVEITRDICQVLPDIRVLVLSAYDDDDYVFALMEAGATGYLLKTARSEEVVEAVRAVHAGEIVLHPAIARKIARIWAGGSSGDDSDTNQPGPDRLTPREMEVLRLVTKGMRNKDIAQALSVSIRTIEGHLNNIYGKLGVSSRTEAVVYSVAHNWFDLGKGSDSHE